MAVSRAERRWSKEPRMVTMLSVIVWLFCSDSLMNAALSLRACIACGTPIFFPFPRRIFPRFLSVSPFVQRENANEKREKLRMRDSNAQCVTRFRCFWLSPRNTGDESRYYGSPEVLCHWAGPGGSALLRLLLCHSIYL
jgi:hypothetical protein